MTVPPLPEALPSVSDITSRAGQCDSPAVVVQEGPMHAQGVIVEFDYGYEELDRLHELELRLMAAIDEAGVGEYDGHEIAMDGTDGTLYMYGPDADSLFAVVRPLLESSSFMQGATAALQYGPPDDTTPVKFVIIGD